MSYSILVGMNSKRYQIFPQVLSTPVGAISEEMNVEIRNSIMSCIHLFKVLEKEQVGEEFMKNNFIGDKRKKMVGKMLQAFLKQGCYI